MENKEESLPADVSMCTNTICELKKHCLRHTAKPKGDYQVYSFFEPNDAISCDNLIKTREDLLLEP